MHPIQVREQARDLARRGLGDRQIAETLGVPRTTVRDWRAPGAPKLPHACLLMLFSGTCDQVGVAHRLYPPRPGRAGQVTINRREPVAMMCEHVGIKA